MTQKARTPTNIPQEQWRQLPIQPGKHAERQRDRDTETDIVNRKTYTSTLRHRRLKHLQPHTQEEWRQLRTQPRKGAERQRDRDTGTDIVNRKTYTSTLRQRRLEHLQTYPRSSGDNSELSHVKVQRDKETETQEQT